jgi:hypothetical protein
MTVLPTTSHQLCLSNEEELFSRLTDGQKEKLNKENGVYGKMKGFWTLTTDASNIVGTPIVGYTDPSNPSADMMTSAVFELKVEQAKAKRFYIAMAADLSTDKKKEIHSAVTGWPTVKVFSVGIEKEMAMNEAKKMADSRHETKVESKLLTGGRNKVLGK